MGSVTTLPPAEVMFVVGGIARVQEAFKSIATSMLALERTSMRVASIGSSAFEKFGRDATAAFDKIIVASHKANDHLVASQTQTSKAMIVASSITAGALAEHQSRIVDANRKAARECSESWKGAFREQERAARTVIASRGGSGRSGGARGGSGDDYGTPMWGTSMRNASFDSRRESVLGAAYGRAEAPLGSSRSVDVLGTAAATFKSHFDLDAALTRFGTSIGNLPFDAINFGFDALKSGVGLAADALKAFGGFVISDVIKPQLKLGMTSTQMANRLGGSVSADAIRGEINADKHRYAGLGEGVVEGVFGHAIDRTHDFGRAKEVADVSLKAGQALGVDPMKLANMLGYMRGNLSGLSAKEFEATATEMVRKTMAPGSRMTADELASNRDRISPLVAGFGGHTDQQRAHTEIGVVGLLAAASARGGARSMVGLEHLSEDMRRNTSVRKYSVDKGGNLVDLSQSLPVLLGKVHGDLSKLGGGSKEGMQLGQISMGGGFNKSSIDFIKNLGIADVYKHAEAEKKGSGQDAVRAALEKIMRPNRDAATFNAENSAVEKTGQVRLNEALERLKESFYGLVPVVEKKLVPALQEAVPKVSKAIDAFVELIAGLDFDDVGSAMKTFATVIGQVIYGIAKLANATGLISVSPEALDKIGASVGDRDAKSRMLDREKADAVAAGDATEEGGASTWGAAREDAELGQQRINDLAALHARKGQPGVAGARDPRFDGFNASTFGQTQGFNAVSGAAEADPAAFGGKMADAFIAKIVASKVPQTPMSDPARLQP